MRVVYHIDNNCSNVGPVVRAVADFHKMKGLSDVYLGITQIGAYERFKLHQYLDIEKQGTNPNLDGFDFAHVIEYDSSPHAQSILARITGILENDAGKGPIGEPFLAAYRAFFNQQKKRGVPLPASPEPQYREGAADAETRNNNLLVMRAISTHSGKGEKIDEAKKNLDEIERTRIIKDIFATEKTEPEAHVVITNDGQYAHDLAPLISERGKEFAHKAARSILPQRDAVFVISPQELVEGVQQAMLIEKYGGTVSPQAASVVQRCEAAIGKGKLSKHLQMEIDPRDLKRSRHFANSYLEFLTNPPVQAAGVSPA